MLRIKSPSSPSPDLVESDFDRVCRFAREGNINELKKLLGIPKFYLKANVPLDEFAADFEDIPLLQDSNGQSPLTQLAREGSYSACMNLFRALLDKEIPDCMPDHHTYFLSYVIKGYAQGGNDAAVRHILKWNGDDDNDLISSVAAGYASAGGIYRAERLIDQRGAKPAGVIYEAAMLQSLEVILRLIKKYSEIDNDVKPSLVDEAAAGFAHASGENYKNNVNALLGMGADIDYVTRHYAQAGRIGDVHELIIRGADPACALFGYQKSRCQAGIEHLLEYNLIEKSDAVYDSACQHWFAMAQQIIDSTSGDEKQALIDSAAMVYACRGLVDQVNHLIKLGAQKLPLIKYYSEHRWFSYSSELMQSTKQTMGLVKNIQKCPDESNILWLSYVNNARFLARLMSKVKNKDKILPTIQLNNAMMNTFEMNLDHITECMAEYPHKNFTKLVEVYQETQLSLPFLLVLTPSIIIWLLQGKGSCFPKDIVFLIAEHVTELSRKSTYDLHAQICKITYHGARDLLFAKGRQAQLANLNARYQDNGSYRSGWQPQ